MSIYSRRCGLRTRCVSQPASDGSNCRQRFSFPFFLSFFNIIFWGGGFRLEPMGCCWWRLGEECSVDNHLVRQGGWVVWAIQLTCEKGPGVSGPWVLSGWAGEAAQVQSSLLKCPLISPTRAEGKPPRG